MHYDIFVFKSCKNKQFVHLIYEEIVSAKKKEKEKKTKQNILDLH